MTKRYDVIIVGCGPAGIFAALELTKAPDLSVLLIEKGRDIDGRQCLALDWGSPCISCSPCRLVCGLGGAGVSRGLIQSSASGVVAASEILREAGVRAGFVTIGVK